ncbi:MAG: radical SAM protein [Deltaproteobacteria bacterium]|nr:radical SAM protein [Deltaproteobacteria bacterium]MBW2419828.1 radical SAM protein [Deltaproteobacteria bacterium]
MQELPTIRAELVGHYREDVRYPAAMVNVTNRCNLECEHCFIFRPANPNEAPLSLGDEMDDEAMLETLARLRDRHGIVQVVWMGGEPLLRAGLLARGIELFDDNTITTNGTVPLVDFGPRVLYVASLDGPQDINDAIRGEGVYRRVMDNLGQLPESFASPVQVQCVVTRRNQQRLEELVEALLQSDRVGWMTFTFYVPKRGDAGPDAWPDNSQRGEAVGEVMRLKEKHPEFIRNTRRSLELMLPPLAGHVTAGCLARDQVLPLYLEGDHFTTPFCCYGNDADCLRCGAWIVFQLASGLPRYAEDSALLERFSPPG